MKTAVLISGQVRTLDRCADSIRRHLLEPLGDYDIIAHVADDEDAGKLELLGRLTHVEKVQQPDLPEGNYIHRTGRGVYGIQGVLRQLWSLDRSMELAMDWANEASAFTHAVRLRTDTFFLNTIEPPSTWQIGTHIPGFFNFYGLNDRFAFGDFWSMVAYHDRFAHLDEQMARGVIFQPETMLAEHLAHYKVPVHRTAVVFDTIRADGTRVPPAWNAGAQYGDVRP